VAVEEEERAVEDKGRRIRNFRLKVLDLFEGEKELLQRRIQRAFDAQEALQDLTRADPSTPVGSERVAALIAQIRGAGQDENAIRDKDFWGGTLKISCFPWILLLFNVQLIQFSEDLRTETEMFQVTSWILLPWLLWAEDLTP